MRWILVVAVAALCGSPASRALAEADVPGASVDSLPRTKHFGRAGAEVFATNFAVWSYDRFIREGGTNPGFRIGLRPWGENLRNGFEFDDNSFSTNQFAHPYHGNLYFNAARSNGYEFWESIPFSFAGSFMWEYFGEIHHPAMNDWVATSVGGIALGEVTHRLSALVIDNTATGGRRRWREFAGLLINPLGGFNRMITGEAFRVGPNPPGVRPGYLGSTLRLGLRSISENRVGVADTSATFGELGLVYGDPFSGTVRKPFDYFAFGLEMDSRETALIARVNAVGLLHGGDVRSNERVRHFLGAFQYYDYFDNRAFQFGGQSVGVGFLSKFQAVDEMEFHTALHLGAMLFGGTSTDYEGYTGRSYDYGPGLQFRLAAGFRRNGWDVLNVGTQQYAIFPLNGNRGNHLVSMSTIRVQVPLKHELAPGLDYALYLADRRYDDFPTVHARYPIIRGFISFKLD